MKPLYYLQGKEMKPQKIGNGKLLIICYNWKNFFWQSTSWKDENRLLVK